MNEVITAQSFTAINAHTLRSGGLGGGLVIFRYARLKNHNKAFSFIYFPSEQMEPFLHFTHFYTCRKRLQTTRQSQIAQISKLQEVPFSSLFFLSRSTLICLWFCVSPIDLKRRMFWNRGWPVETRVVSVMRRWNAQADPHEWVTMETVETFQSILCTHCAMCAQRTKKRSTILTRDCVFNGHALYTNIGTLLMFPLEGESSGVHRNDAI